MGTFKYAMPSKKRTARSNHKRTATFTVVISSNDINKAASVIENANSKWSAQEEATLNGRTAISVSYGPVYGSFASDISRKFIDNNVPLFGGPILKHQEHADDCDHPSHRHE